VQFFMAEPHECFRGMASAPTLQGKNLSSQRRFPQISAGIAR
jgi:hypothetical protein